MDSMSLMFMEIGRSAPSYQRMALLYPQSRHLQANVLEYFILVVQLCHRMLKYSKKSGLKQFFNSTYSSSSMDRKDLERWSLAIRDEMNIAMAQANREETQKTSGFRFVLRQDTNQIRLYQQQAAKLRILDTISTYDYETTWKQLRKVGNTTILTDNTTYLTWKSFSKSNTLILLGQLGAGKSIVLANMIDDLFLSCPSDQALIVYFFCRHDIPESLVARTIIGAIARQLLKHMDISALPSGLIRDRYVIEDITAIVSESLAPDAMVYVILDGIHECDAGNQSEVFTFLADLPSSMHLSMCVSTRTQESLATEELTTLGRDLVYISMPQDNPDIGIYIEQELENLLVSDKMVIRDPHIVLEIRDQLVSKSEGMFLWVYLQILLLCFENSDHGIRQVLKELPLPQDLATTYARILDKTTKTIKDDVRTKFLSLIVAAFRPLTVKELQESLSVTLGDTSWDISKLITDITTVFSACSGLLVLDEEQETIRLVHASALQFLQNETKYLMGDIHEAMAYTIFTYLHYPLFETSISSTVVPTIDAKLIPPRVIASTLRPSTNIQRMAIRLLKSRTSKEQDISKTLAEQRQKVADKSDFQFQHYAREYWLRHLCETKKLNSAASKLLARLFQSRKLSLDDIENFCQHTATMYQSWTELLTKSMTYIDTGPTQMFSFLCWAVEHGCTPVVKLILDNSRIDVNRGLASDIHPLKIAIETRNQDMVSLLLKYKRVRCDWSVYGGGSPLEIALNLEDYQIASILLQDDRIDPNGFTIEAPTTLLMRAVIKRNVTTAILLLECARTDKNKHTADGTALHHAISKADSILDHLLSAPDVNVNARDNKSRTPLYLAISEGSDLQVISKLLSVERLDPNIADLDGRTPLHRACQNMKIDIVKLLASDSRVDLDAQDKEGSTALALAVYLEYLACVQALLWQEVSSPEDHILREDLDPNLADFDGWTPLHIAALHGMENIVRELLKVSIIRVRLQHDVGETPAQVARRRGHTDIGQLLDEHQEKEEEKKSSHDPT